MADPISTCHLVRLLLSHHRRQSRDMYSFSQTVGSRASWPLYQQQRLLSDRLCREHCLRFHHFDPADASCLGVADAH